jgi:hypothetical protein
MLKKAITFWSLSWEHRCDGVSRNPITIPWVWYEVINLHNFPHGCLCDCHPRIPRKCDGVSGNPIKFLSYTTSVGLIGILMGLIGTGWLRPTFGSEMWRGFWKPHHKT